jgi:hypothetical protein
MNDKLYIQWLEERIVSLEIDLAIAHQNHLDSLDRLINSISNPTTNA